MPRSSLASAAVRAWFPMVVVLLLACVARADDRPLAVFAVAGAGDAAARTRLEERVRMAAGRYATVQPAEVTAQALRSATTLGLSCDLALVECARRMGALAGAGRVVVGALEHDDTLALGLIAVDASGPAPVTQRLRLPAPGVARDAAVERLVMMLLAPERLLGRLLLDVAPVGARIVVDDVFRGPAPLRAPLTGVHVEANHPAFVTWLQDGIDLRPDAPLDIVLARGRTLRAHLRQQSGAPVQASDVWLVFDGAPTVIGRADGGGRRN